ncbi:hypothetical protein PYCC9005_001637 [Savitreella phatthalungensis]
MVFIVELWRLQPSLSSSSSTSSPVANEMETPVPIWSGGDASSVSSESDLYMDHGAVAESEMTEASVDIQGPLLRRPNLQRRHRCCRQPNLDGFVLSIADYGRVGWEKNPPRLSKPLVRCVEREASSLRSDLSALKRRADRPVDGKDNDLTREILADMLIRKVRLLVSATTSTAGMLDCCIRVRYGWRNGGGSHIAHMLYANGRMSGVWQCIQHADGFLVGSHDYLRPFSERDEKTTSYQSTRLGVLAERAAVLHRHAQKHRTGREAFLSYEWQIAMALEHLWRRMWSNWQVDSHSLNRHGSSATAVISIKGAEKLTGIGSLSALELTADSEDVPAEGQISLTWTCKLAYLQTGLKIMNRQKARATPSQGDGRISHAVLFMLQQLVYCLMTDWQLRARNDQVASPSNRNRAKHSPQSRTTFIMGPLGQCLERVLILTETVMSRISLHVEHNIGQALRSLRKEIGFCLRILEDGDQLCAADSILASHLRLLSASNF